MTESTVPKRLSKVALEFNVGISTIVDFLSKKGMEIDSNPNTKVPHEYYVVLKKEYQGEKSVKEKSQKISIGAASKSQSVTIDSPAPSNEEKPDEESKELLIKNVHNLPIEEEKEPSPKKKAELKLKIIGKIDIDAKKKVAEKFEEPEVKPAEPIAEEEAVKAPEEQKEEVTEVVRATAPPPRDVKIIGKIDVEESSKSSKKKKKTVQEKEQEISAAPPPPEEPIEEVIAEVQEVISEPEILPEETFEEPEIQEDDDEIEIAQDNFLKTEFHKLEGPTILGKIELPSAKEKEKKKKQPIASSNVSFEQDEKKRKRKRIKKELIPAKEVKTDKDPIDKSAKGKKDKRKKEKPKLKAEPSEEEIQKHIKETLAKLSASGGKSKASKLRRQKREQVSMNQRELEEQMELEKSVLKVTEFVTVSELASMMDVQVNQIIASCMTLGIFVSINQRLDAETLSIVAEEFGFTVEFVSVDVQDYEPEQEEVDESQLEEKAPIVTVMGHVDHGKTSLLDYIRKTNVIAGEAGGITQHIGAYNVWLDNGKRITFLDTPGHEAFTAMRARGAKVTDVAIIVVAADDNVMPQTVEAINHAQAAGVPIVFAINKIDKPNANPEKVKEELANMNLLVEDWGGKYQSQEISAKQGINIDLLLDKVLLEAELLELKANKKKAAIGTVLESKLDKGRGYIATILVENGSLKVGDVVLAGCHYGKVKAMFNERNQKIDEAGPATPALILGLNGAPQAGDKINMVHDEKEAKDIAQKRTQLQREQGIRTQKHITLDEIGRRIAIGDFKELNIIVKGDVDGSIEALADSLLKLSTPKVQINIIHKSVGQVSESDVMLASASNAIIIAFQVRPSVSARKLAEKEEIDLRLYSIIYDAINEVRDAMEGMLSPEIQEKIVCNIEVREVFKISKVGTIAGCLVMDGKINRNTKVRLIRDGIVIYTGNMNSLKRYKDEVKEVISGMECGISIANFNDIKVGDIIEGFEEIQIKQKL